MYVSNSKNKKHLTLKVVKDKCNVPESFNSQTIKERNTHFASTRVCIIYSSLQAFSQMSGFSLFTNQS